MSEISEAGALAVQQAVRYLDVDRGSGLTEWREVLSDVIATLREQGWTVEPPISEHERTCLRWFAGDECDCGLRPPG